MPTIIINTRQNENGWFTCEAHRIKPRAYAAVMCHSPFEAKKGMREMIGFFVDKTDKVVWLPTVYNRPQPQHFTPTPANSN